MKQLTIRQRFVVSLTLFSMFFGAGNLIFPPFLGAQAGTGTWTAMAGFAVSAIGFPILGVVAVAVSGGLKELAGRVHPKFAFLFTLLIYLSIGPCLAIPRTASTSFEMAVLPFLDARNGTSGSSLAGIAQLLYSIAFFITALWVARRPDQLTDRLGRILAPCLLAMIFFIVAGCLIRPAASYGEPFGAYGSHRLIQGFLDGYQTMDTIAALNFGLIIALNIKALGIREEKSVVKETIAAGWMAGTFLLLVYCGLAHAGAVSESAFPGSANGAQTLTALVSWLYGPVGTVILALVFLIACLNTCIGLISCCSQYFASTFPILSYNKWAFVFAFASMVISNAGLNKILAFSVPVLNAVYPVAIMLIMLGLGHAFFRKFRYVYPVTIGCTSFISVMSALEQSALPLGPLTAWTQSLPLSSVGLAWLVPAVIGMATGMGSSVLILQETRKNSDVVD